MTKLLFGHRGSSDNYPENTLFAFHKAIEEGAHGIEMDVRKSIDGTYLVMHDSTVDRTTNGSGSISKLEWSYISSLDAGAWKGTEFANSENTKVPRLEEILDEFGGEAVILMLHFKIDLNDIKKVIDLLHEKDVIARCIIFASKDDIGKIKQYDPYCFVMNCGMNHSNHDKLLEQAQEEKWNAISWNASNITADIVRNTHQAGLFINASYLSSDYQKNTQTIIDLDVDFILGNDCLSMVATGRRNGIMQLSALTKLY